MPEFGGLADETWAPAPEVAGIGFGVLALVALLARLI